jgi:U3 small nucleolar RNA-associated protein 12
MDRLKFFLSLYGHKLPVLSMDISSDSSLLISGSADKNIKIWGLDFGDCHRSLFAHADSIMQVRSSACFSVIADTAALQRACTSAKSVLQPP